MWCGLSNKLIFAGYASFSASGSVNQFSYSTTQPAIQWDSDFIAKKVNAIAFQLSSAPSSGLTLALKSLMTGNTYVKAMIGNTLELPVGNPFKGATNSPVVSFTNAGIIFTSPDKPVMSPNANDSTSTVALYNPTAASISYSAMTVSVYAVITE